MSFPNRATLAAFLGCSAILAGAPLAAQDRVVAALEREPDSLNPIYDTGLAALNVFYNIFDQLATIDATGAVAPRLAESWVANDTLDEWTFTLREGASFHDGTPVTAADVIFTFETAMNDSTSRLGGYLTTIESIVAPDDFTVVFSLNQPFAPFDRQVTLVPIVSATAYEAMGAEAFARNPVGSGPYDFVEWHGSDLIELTRFDDYWGDQGTFETVIFQPVPDETTRANSVQSGDVDIALLGPSSVAGVEAGGVVDIISQQSNRILYLGFNSSHPVLGDPEVREAIDMAIDRATLSERLMNGAVEPTGQLVAPVSFGYDPDLPAQSYDPDGAVSALTAAGYDGAPVPLAYPSSGLPQIDQIAQVVAYFLEEVGINVTLQQTEQSTYSGAWFASEMEGMYLYAFAPTVMDADLPFSMLLRSGGQGYTFDDRIDALLDAEVGESDDAVRADLLSQISAIVDDQTIYAPLFTDTYTYGVTQGLEWSPRPDGLMTFY
jgi:peptide/nickel transport system substrate-binding protein